MTTTELRELMAAATPGPWSCLYNNITAAPQRKSDPFPVPVGVTHSPFREQHDAALIVALVNSAEELLDKADKYDAIMDKKVAVFCHPGEGD